MLQSQERPRAVRTGTEIGFGKRWKQVFSRLILALALPLLLLGAAGCAGALNLVTSSGGYTVLKNQRYAAHDRGVYDLYIPDTADANTPLVIFIHGGSWDSGSKDTYLFVGQSLAAAGYIVAVPNYRLYPEVTFPAFVEDAAEAVRVISRNVDGGISSIPAGRHPRVLMGHSAGAQIGALLATDSRYFNEQGMRPRDLAGFIGLAGPYDFLPLQSERLREVFPEPSREASQPINFVDGDEPPMLLIAGTADTTVGPRNSEVLAAAVRRAGGSAALELVPDIGHVEAISSFATALELGEPRIRKLAIEFIERITR